MKKKSLRFQIWLENCVEFAWQLNCINIFTQHHVHHDHPTPGRSTKMPNKVHKLFAYKYFQHTITPNEEKISIIREFLNKIEIKKFHLCWILFTRKYTTNVIKIGIKPKKQNIKSPMLSSSRRFVVGTLNHGVHFIAIFSLFLVLIKNDYKIKYLNELKIERQSKFFTWN